MASSSATASSVPSASAAASMAAERDSDDELSADSDDESESEEEESEESEESEEEEEPQMTWEEAKAAGNALYTKKDYRNSIPMYTQAIALNPTMAALYGNRAAAHLMMGSYPKVLDDCSAAIKLDETFVKAYYRSAKANLLMGNTTGAIAMFRECLLRDADNKSYHAEKNQAELVVERVARLEGHLQKRKFKEALSVAESTLKLCPAAKHIKLMHVQALNGVGRQSEAFSICSRLLRDAPTDAGLLALRAKCLYLQGNFEQASNHVRHALRSDPDNKEFVKLFKLIKKLEAKKAEGNKHFKFARWQEAIDSYTECLEIDPENGSFNAKLYCNRGTCYAKMRKHAEAVDDCTRALELDAEYAKALMRRAASLQALGELENLENAVRDLTKAMELSEDSKELQKSLREAKGMLKNAKRKDFYKILGCARDAREPDIKKAYRKAALKWHPDRWVSKTEREQKVAETNFKQVSEAYEVLSDPQKRSRYDSGVDIDDLDNEHAGRGGGGGFGGMDPNDLFSMFMGGGMGGMGGGMGARAPQGFGGF